jgi:hypothetical protein
MDKAGIDIDNKEDAKDAMTTKISTRQTTTMTTQKMGGNFDYRTLKTPKTTSVV